jgi:hypothetical protein
MEDIEGPAESVPRATLNQDVKLGTMDPMRGILIPKPATIGTNAKIRILEQLGGLSNPKLSWTATFLSSKSGIAEAFSYPTCVDISGIFGFDFPKRYINLSSKTSGQAMLDLMKNWEDRHLEYMLVDKPDSTQYYSQDSVYSVPRPLDSQIWATNALEKKSAEIIACIQRATELKQPNSNVSFRWLRRYEALCRLFFSKSMILHFLESYWGSWSGNFFNVHRPTFDPVTAHTPLLATMVLMGAALCPQENYRNAAATFFDAVEEWLFQHEDFTEVPLEVAGNDSDLVQVERRMNALRAAHMMVLIQTYEGSKVAHTRVIYQRYAQLVAVARSLCNACNTHGDLRKYIQSPDPREAWNRFRVIEDVIRTVNYAFLTDWCHCMFRNTLPLVRLDDLFIDLACPAICYQAPTVSLWQSSMKIWAESDIGRRQMSYADAMLIMCEESVSPEDSQVLMQMSNLNLCTLIFGFNAMIAHLRAAQGFVKPSENIRYALENWAEAWTHRKPWPGLDEDQSPFRAGVNGFPYRCQEFYCVAYVLLRKLSHRDRITQGRGHRKPRDDTLDFLSLITDFSQVMLELDGRGV